MTFEEFWKGYPRKVSRKTASVAFAKLSSEDRELVRVALPVHCRYWVACGTEVQFIPHASTWLNQGRWEDELEMPKPKVGVQIAWWTNEPDTLEQGRRYGLMPRGGEDWNQFRARIRDAMRGAA